MTGTVLSGVIASNAALQAELLPGRASRNARSGVTNDAARVALFVVKRARVVEENEEAKKPTRPALLTLRHGTRGGCSRSVSSHVCIMQASVPRGACDAIKRIIRDERRRRGEPVGEMAARGPSGPLVFAFR
jgi:hypothetical protein